MAYKTQYRIWFVIVLILFSVNSIIGQKVNIDSLSADQARAIIKNEVKKEFKKSLLPGYAQIKTKQYWKLPVYYGGYVLFGSLALDQHIKFKHHQTDFLNKYNEHAPYSYYSFTDEEINEIDDLNYAAIKYKHKSYMYLAGAGLLYLFNLCEGINPVYKHYRSPYKAGLYSALIPGLGQIYNGHWWKTPFVYIGIGTFAFFINFNHVEYQKNLQAYYIKSDEEATKYALEYLYNNRQYYEERDIWDNLNLTKGRIQKIETYSRLERYSTEKLIKEKEEWKRNRDMVIAGLIAFYGVNILDAVVYSHLFDYDVSDELTFKIRPNIINNPKQPVNIGATFALNF